MARNMARKINQSMYVDNLLIERTVTFKGDIVINTNIPNARIIINGREITLETLDRLEELDKLTEMVTAMWFAPGMPGANSIASEVEDLDKK